MINKEQIAHDLALVYLNNRFGPEITSDFEVYSFEADDVRSRGSVDTERLPELMTVATKQVPTGEKTRWLKNPVTKTVEDGYEIDPIFLNMIQVYQQAYNRILLLLN